jgi:DNA polymerase
MTRSRQILLPPSPDRQQFDLRAVMPEGSLAPHVYLVGEAPGRQEAEAGRPFVGPAGKALRDMMREAGMGEAQLRLANALPFRPNERSAKRGQRNRRPTEKELRDYGRSCLPISPMFGRS